MLLETPRAQVDRARLERNCARMRGVARRHGVTLRPHVKTAKCAPIAELCVGDGPRTITVSTLAEADYFVARGFDDLLYAVGVVPGKLAHLERLARDGARIGVLTDDVAVARALAERPVALRCWIEIDSGDHRGGVDPGSDALLELARILDAAPEVALAGVLTHAGHSYRARGPEAIADVAEMERATAVEAAERIRATGIECPGVSVGSTPTALHARTLEGVTELRAGVYVFCDLFQAAIGACADDDLALSVLAAVVSSRDGAAWIDAGALALSQDRSLDFAGGGYGRVSRPDGGPLAGAPRVVAVHQEHGRIEPTSGALDMAELPVGATVRVWPNHACLTAAMYDGYDVLGPDGAIEARWERLRG
ncbi:MAG: alanine racemase [Sandaracinaceae bacterium]